LSSSIPSSQESASKFVELKDLSNLLTNTRTYITEPELSRKEKNYFKSKQSVLSIVKKGYSVLPSVYFSEFVDPLKKAFTHYYDEISGLIKRTDDASPFVDWLDSIQQRHEGYLGHATNAFEEVINDLFDGWLSAESRIEVKHPDNQTVSSLVRWADTEDNGPYTVGASNDILEDFKIRMSVVTMPPSYSKNIALWGGIAHECAHDITLADNGLLAECTNLVYNRILNEPRFNGQEVTYNGRREAFSRRAAEVWKYWMYETVADVLGVLNFGPSAGLALAVILISLQGGYLKNFQMADDQHPIDILRIYLAADVVRDIPSLHANIANPWSDALESVADKYALDKNNFAIKVNTPSDTFDTVIFPFESLRDTVKIVAQSLAFAPLQTLENHSFSEINTWTREDEILANRIADELLNKKEPSIEKRGGEATVYPSHILAGAVVALTDSAQIPEITRLAIPSLNKFHEINPLWQGYPIRYASDYFVHKFLSTTAPKINSS